MDDASGGAAMGQIRWRAQKAHDEECVVVGTSALLATLLDTCLTFLKTKSTGLSCGGARLCQEFCAGINCAGVWHWDIEALA